MADAFEAMRKRMRAGFDDFPILSAVLGVSKESASCDCQKRYNTFELKSRGTGKARAISAPCQHLKLMQRALLDRILCHVAPHDAAMAFVRGRSIASNARRHHRATHIFTTDICSFFPSITAAHLSPMFEKRFRHLSSDAIKEIIDLVTDEGRLPQGAPTSPHLANLVMFDFDERCSWFCDRLGAVYTRYADDISISAKDAETLRHIASVVAEGLRALAMQVNPEKTRHLGPLHRKTVTGLDIGGERIRPTRTFRKKTAALVRMSVRYPDKMQRHRSRVCGYLAFWHGVDPADRELAKLVSAMGLDDWTERILAASAFERQFDGTCDYTLGGQIPF
ncbi:reverse transcriptase family protein [Defluviimonas sp. WL0002]|uniref:RNA-directed DNA polymerase n=1 Tax=Albidovulum marisflavi TaxID=2984159 RepID=A0ABT2Z8H1_9RHOB|nr:reverse transcriptase family protein [Defluviimonas sp. WL0002]MCV2867434.1 reverse transcriptase family protein [Defluviimonas sp. WL0002]